MQKRAFTLIELMIVIVIIAVLAGALVPIFRNFQEDAKVAKYLNLVETLKVATQKFYVDTGILPYAEIIPGTSQHYYCLSNNTFEGNPGGVCVQSGWDGPYLDRQLSQSDSPFPLGDGYLDVWDCQCAEFDLDGDGTTWDEIGKGVELMLSAAGIPRSFAKKINDAYDKDLPESNWERTGRITYDDRYPNRLDILVYGECRSQ